METSASFEVRSAPSSYPTESRTWNPLPGCSPCESMRGARRQSIVPSTSRDLRQAGRFCDRSVHPITHELRGVTTSLRKSFGFSIHRRVACPSPRRSTWSGLHRVITALSHAERSLPDRSRSFRDLPRRGCARTGGRGVAPFHRGGVSELSAVRVARRGLRAVSVYGLRWGPARSLLV